MKLILIAAMAANRVIGRNNAIPWQLPEEMEHFKKTTMGHTLIMGRKTYASIGGPLSGRRNIIVTANPSFQAHPDCIVAASLPQAIALCQGEEKVFVIGGAQLYRAALPLADTLILTVIGKDFVGDTFFPDFAAQPFQLVDSRELPASVLPLTVNIYRRIEPSAVSSATT